MPDPVFRAACATVLAPLALCLTLLAGAAVAQSGETRPLPTASPILTVDSERLFLESAFGRRIQTELEAAGARLAAENRNIEAELEAEEKTLTEQRASLSAEEFRELADAFDERVQTIRRDREERIESLNQQLDGARERFRAAAGPVLEELMREAGAAVILDIRSVFLSLNAIDVTEMAIDRIDAVLGDSSPAAGQD